MNPLDIMERKYLLMESSQSELGSILAHNACNLAMALIGQVNGRIRKVWAVSAN
jgi:hypothetical protein